MTTRIGTRLALLGIALATIGCDRITKQAATTMLADAPVRSYFGDTVRLAYDKTPAAFSAWARTGRCLSARPSSP